MNIHFVNDEKFINKNIKDFESFYPDKNLFFVKDDFYKKKGHTKYVDINNKNVFLWEYGTSTVIDHIVSKANKIDNVFVHCLDAEKAFWAMHLKEKFNCKIYWIFYGSDLYGWLYVKGRYRIYDRPSLYDRSRSILAYFVRLLISTLRLGSSVFKIRNKFIKNLDYFCFWNPYDFELLKSNFSTNAEFKPFIYNVFNYSEKQMTGFSKPYHIIVNQSGSKSGNHITVLQKLLDIDVKNEIQKITIPLSYGNTQVVKKVTAFSKKHFSYVFAPLSNFMEKNEYNSIMQDQSVAIYGHRRQEAAGNIFMALASGAKIFLRKDNNLLKFLKESGYHIYEFEKDLKTISDLLPLSTEMAIYNNDLFYKQFSEKNINEIYQNLIRK